MNVSLLLSILASAAVYAALATAVVVVYRSNHVLSFHVAELGVLAAYIMVSIAVGPGTAGLSLPLAFGVALTVVLGITLLVHVVIDHWGRPFGHFVGTVLTIAIGGIIMGIVGMVWSGQTMRLILVEGHVTLLGENVSLNTLAIITACSLAVAAVHIIVANTRLGIAMRAVANNHGLAGLRGISVPRVLLTAWLFSAVLSTIAGIGMASLSSVAMEGSVIGVSAVVAAILGGLTSLGGAIIGALLLAFGEQLISVHINARYSQVVPILALLIILSIRPSGLSGHTERVARV